MNRTKREKVEDETKKGTSMHKYVVKMCRTEHTYKDIEVEAENPLDALDAAEYVAERVIAGMGWNHWTGECNGNAYTLHPVSIDGRNTLEIDREYLRAARKRKSPAVGKSRRSQDLSKYYLDTPDPASKVIRRYNTCGNTQLIFKGIVEGR